MARIVVIGTGIAGLTTALRLAGTHEVVVVTKGRCGESTTALAQGGIAGALDPADSVEAHVADTLSAGAGLCDEAAVRVLCAEGPERILELAEAGVEFDRIAEADERHRRHGPAVWARGIEGAHSVPRIVHSGGDATGQAIIDALLARLLAEVDAGSVELREHTMLLDLATSADGSRVVGVWLLADGAVDFAPADAVVLATGGAGRLFAHTTNPAGATGDGLAAAIRAGAEVRDLEFVQFHPTALAGTGFLISEAVRGAGALLLDARGRRFMPDLDPRAELAARNVVALGIHRTMAGQNGLPCHLDARAVPDVCERFPSIASGVAAHGLSLAEDLIPITPAAHYLMGGIATDLEGRTSLGGLVAVGEVACTGVHGANRLASNSLLEGAVFGTRAAEAIAADLAGATAPEAGTVPAGRPTRTGDGPPSVALSRTDLQALTWENLGIERTAQGLTALLDRLGETPGPLPHRARPGTGSRLGEGDVDVHAIETANLALIARTMAEHALARSESTGAHVRTDRPAPSAAPTPPAPGPPAPTPRPFAGHPSLDPDREEAASC